MSAGLNVVERMALAASILPPAHELRTFSADESDRERDQAAQAEVRAFARRTGGSHV